MSTKLAISSLALAAAFLSSPSYAADVLSRGGMKDDVAPVADRTINWSGIFVGGALGYGMVDHEIAAGSYFDFDGLSSNGFNGCGILGVKRQMGTFVVGAEGRGCLSNISTDLTIGGEKGSLDLDRSYALYAELGYAQNNWLLSALGGYKWQHYKITGGSDDTVGGISGGGTAQLALDGGRWVIGPEVLFTKFDDQDLGEGIKDKPLEFEANFRVTYHFGIGN